MANQPLARVAQGAFLPLITRRPVAICMFMVAIAVLGVVSFTYPEHMASLGQAGGIGCVAWGVLFAGTAFAAQPGPNAS